jgi:anti-sigma B factor antagonist
MRITVERNGTVARIALDGEIDVANAESFDQAFREIVGTAPSALAIDLLNVTFIDSTGLHVLTRLATVCREKGIDARIHPSAPVARLLLVTGLDKVLPLAPVPGPDGALPST